MAAAPGPENHWPTRTGTPRASLGPAVPEKTALSAVAYAAIGSGCTHEQANVGAAAVSHNRLDRNAMEMMDARRRA